MHPKGGAEKSPTISESLLTIINFNFITVKLCIFSS